MAQCVYNGSGVLLRHQKGTRQNSNLFMLPHLCTYVHNSREFLLTGMRPYSHSYIFYRTVFFVNEQKHTNHTRSA